MLERDLERRLALEVTKLGGLAYKFSSPSHRGVPDRLCLFPDGLAVFVELKQEGKKARPLQVHEMKKIASKGFRCYVVDSERALQLFLHEVMTMM